MSRDNWDFLATGLISLIGFGFGYAAGRDDYKQKLLEAEREREMNELKRQIADLKRSR